MIYRFRRVVGGNVVPEDEDTQKAVSKMKMGDVLHGKFTKQRNIGFHRKYFAMLNHAFESWEPDTSAFSVTPPKKNFDQFRGDIMVMAGFYDSVFRVDGSLRLMPLSISFAKMDQDEFEGVYSATVDVILQHVLTNYTREDIDRVVNEIMRFT